jgi:transcriptional regulator with XRE-family HTH domain
MPKNQQLKTLIEKVKLEFDLTQKQIADKLGVKNTYLSDMINMRVPFTEKIENKLYEQFHIQNTSTEEGKKPEGSSEKTNDVISSREFIEFLKDQVRTQQKEIDRLIALVELYRAEKEKSKEGIEGVQNVGDVAAG